MTETANQGAEEVPAAVVVVVELLDGDGLNLNSKKLVYYIEPTLYPLNLQLFHGWQQINGAKIKWILCRSTLFGSLRTRLLLPFIPIPQL